MILINHLNQTSWVVLSFQLSDVRYGRSNQSDYRYNIDHLDIEINQEIELREFRSDLSSDGSYFDSRGDYMRVDLSEGKSEFSKLVAPQEFGLMGYEKDQYSKMNKHIWIADSGIGAHDQLNSWTCEYN